MNVVLISTYELGRQPFGLASPTAWLREEGAKVTCFDLAVERLDQHAVTKADLIGFYIPMHTATRLATRCFEQIKELNPDAHYCFYGLYASVNEDYLRKLGADTILGGEFEEGLVSVYRRLSANGSDLGQDEGSGQGNGHQLEPVISMGRQQFQVPDRSSLPQLDRYARVRTGPGEEKVVGYTEATRGCKHLCRHCPIVPVYGGRFRVVQRDIVLEDIARQVAAGAEHITFGDPDFWNGPGHALAIIRELHERFPEVTYDVTIKVEHLLKHAEHLPVLSETGCLFVTCAVEAVDERLLEIFDKRHTRDDLVEVVRLAREAGVVLNPTFVAFSPWITLEGYLDFLETIRDLGLVDQVAPIQYGIRLLIPQGSRLLELSETQEVITKFDEEGLCHRWDHPDPRVDQLCRDVLEIIQDSQKKDECRREIFQRVWRKAREALGEDVAEAFETDFLAALPDRATVPYLTEPWYC